MICLWLNIPNISKTFDDSANKELTVVGCIPIKFLSSGVSGVLSVRNNEIDHSSPSEAEAGNEWSFTFRHSVHLCCVIFHDNICLCLFTLFIRHIFSQVLDLGADICLMFS